MNDYESNKIVSSFTEIHTDYIRTIRQVPNTKRFLTGSYDKTVKLLDYGTSEILTTFDHG